MHTQWHNQNCSITVYVQLLKSMSSHAVPSAPTAAAAPAAADGAKWKTKRQKGLDKLSISVHTKEIMRDKMEDFQINDGTC